MTTLAERIKAVRPPRWWWPFWRPADYLLLGQAAEALTMAAEIVRKAPIDDTETCMCGSDVKGHSMGDGHSPVSQSDYAISWLLETLEGRE